MDSSEDNFGDVSTLLNESTYPQKDSSSDVDFLLERLRVLHIEEYYGEHYRLLFNVTFVVCIIGYITNALNVIVFSRMSLSNSMNLLLLLLAGSDLALITTAFAHIVHYYSGYNLYPFYGYYLFFMINTFLESIFDNVSNWFVVTVAVWRYVAITWPQRCSIWFGKTRVNIIILLIVGLSVLLAFPMFLIFTYQTVEYKGHVFYDRSVSEFANANNRMSLKVFWTFLLLRGLVPMVIMAGATGALVWSLFKSKRETEKESSSHFINLRITLMLVVLMVLFLLSNFPDSCLILLTVVTGGDSEHQSTFRHATDVIRVFMLANNSLSFFIYYGLGVEFRREFKKLFCRVVGSKTDDDSVAESTVGNVELDSPNSEPKTQAEPMKVILN